jgi:hypothetical protein
MRGFATIGGRCGIGFNVMPELAFELNQLIDQLIITFNAVNSDFLPTD